jgi:hypothetical protein
MYCTPFSSNSSHQEFIHSFIYSFSINHTDVECVNNINNRYRQFAININISIDNGSYIQVQVWTVVISINTSINIDSYISTISDSGSMSTWNISSRPFLFRSSTMDEFRSYLIQYRTQLIYIKDLSDYTLHSQGHHSSKSTLYYLFVCIPAYYLVNIFIKILLVVFINTIKKIL